MESSGPAPETLPAEPAARVEAILNAIADEMDLDADVVVEESAEEINARFEGEDLGLVIGRRGQTIDAIQLICYRAAFRDSDDRKRVSVDAAGYREERDGAAHRPSGPQGAAGHRDFQRGLRARTVRGRGPARQ
jgi:predicted RNA-binding protein Jag